MSATRDYFKNELGKGIEWDEVVFKTLFPVAALGTFAAYTNYANSSNKRKRKRQGRKRLQSKRKVKRRSLRRRG